MATQTRSNKKKKKLIQTLCILKQHLITQILQFQMNLVMLLLGQQLESRL